MATSISYKYNDIISKSALIQSGSPAVYQLKPKKEKIGTIRRMTLGEKNLNKTNRTILLVGETGAGKSTLINTLVNYTMGVKWEDNVWFQIVEEKKRRQSESQTSDVIVYQIFGFEDKTLPYSLTIIDTPGYGDTRGIEHDEKVRGRLFDLFHSEDGVHEINAVGLVLSDRLRYIFDSVMSLFGKDVEKNIVALITHSDGLPPENVLQALEDANIKCAKDEDNEPVYFLFNNCQSTQRKKKTQFALKYAWDLTANHICQFTDFLKETEPQNLKETVEVLKRRIRLTACIQNLKERVEYIEVKQKEIQQTEEALKKYEQEMKNNENFTKEVEETYKERKEIEGGWWFKWSKSFYEGAVCCTVCEENCHYPGCTMTTSPEKCWIMKGGRCTSCKCPASDHVKEEWIYVNKTRRVRKTKKQMKEKYEKNKTGRESCLSILVNLKKKTEELQKDKDQWLEESFQHVVKLEHTDSLSTLVHLDFLIEKIKEKGDTEKVQKLKEMKRRVDKDKGVLAALSYGFSKLTVGKELMK
uniref:Septin-type G domain-containing protein n=1 Tax=Dicentrarchus labrax TaxID=13489 RepID=A0A8P4GFV0_DICLA